MLSFIRNMRKVKIHVKIVQRHGMSEHPCEIVSQIQPKARGWYAFEHPGFSLIMRVSKAMILILRLKRIDLSVNRDITDWR